jgi:hypothetical protein
LEVPFVEEADARKHGHKGADVADPLLRGHGAHGNHSGLPNARFVASMCIGAREDSISHLRNIHGLQILLSLLNSFTTLANKILTRYII